tara:strand:- start:2804 stop:3595 length:792 start_codon:yes stop_codon:yes gene_type:complete
MLEIPKSFSVKTLLEVTSTNDIACASAVDGADAGTVIVSLNQTSGRGRRGRVWDSSPGNLFFSIILRPMCAPLVAAQASFVASISVNETIRHFIGEQSDVLCKWPNDVLVNKKKIAGILLESQTSGSGKSIAVVDWLIVGIGINVSSVPILPNGELITSINKETSSTIEREDVLNVFLEYFHSFLQVWKNEGFLVIRDVWLNKSFPKGESIKIEISGRMVSGLFLGINNDGSLLMQDEKGIVHTISSGDVFFNSLEYTNASCH